MTRTEELPQAGASAEGTRAPSLLGDRSLATICERTLLGLTLALLTVLLVQIVRRISFPWDIYMWSESPFMTNMWKISAGQFTYTQPEDVNSFVYSTGLEYLAYALLAPFGVAVDVRFCRAVIVGLGLLGCFFGHRAAAGMLRATQLESGSCTVYGWFAGGLTMLILGRNITVDICHPDNLATAHAALTLFFCWRASVSSRLRPAVAAIAFASLGVWCKQPAGAAGFGALAGLLLVRPDLRKGRQLLLVALTAVVVTAIGCALLLASPAGRFWTLEVLLRHKVQIWKILQLVRFDIVGVPHRVLLFAVAAVALVWTLLRSERSVRNYGWLWTVLFVTEVAPSLTAYFKVWGTWNSLGIWDVWASFLVLPVLWYEAARLLRAREQRPELAAWPLGVFLLLIATTLPVRWAPTRAQWAFCRELETALENARTRGERVLLDHTVMPLIRAGFREVPLDRANSMFELGLANLERRAGTAARIRQKHYDRIFLVAEDWYGSEREVINANYEQVASVIAAPRRRESQGYDPSELEFGYQPILLMNTDARILVPKRGAASPQGR